MVKGHQNVCFNMSIKFAIKYNLVLLFDCSVCRDNVESCTKLVPLYNIVVEQSVGNGNVESCTKLVLLYNIVVEQSVGCVNVESYTR